MFFIRRATITDVFYLAEHLRQEDLSEIKAASGKTPLEALISGFLLSEVPFVGCLEDTDEVIAIFGIIPIPDETLKICSVWLLGSPKIDRIKIEFIRTGKIFMDTVLKDYDIAFNYVDSRNTVHLNWCKFNGFNFIRTLKTGVENRDFIEIVRGKLNV